MLFLKSHLVFSPAECFSFYQSICRLDFVQNVPCEVFPELRHWEFYWGGTRCHTILGCPSLSGLLRLSRIVQITLIVLLCLEFSPLPWIVRLLHHYPDCLGFPNLSMIICLVRIIYIVGDCPDCSDCLALSHLSRLPRLAPNYRTLPTCLLYTSDAADE